MKWPVKKLGDVLGTAEIFTDGDWVESKDQDVNGNIRLLQLADIGDGNFINKSNRYINDETFDRLKCTEVKAGDILIARMPDPLGRACIFNGLHQKCITVVDVCVIRVDSAFIDTRWLMHAINSQAVRSQIKNLAKGATRVRISRKNLQELKIEFPPLAEQKRIAALLDTADNVIRLREQAIAKLDELAQSVFENLLRSNDKIERKCLSELTIKVDSINPSEMYGEDEFTYIDIGSVNNELKVIVNPSFVKGLEAPSRARQLVKINDVLISTVRPNLNAVAMVMKDFKRPIGSTGFCVLRCDERKILPDIVFAIAKSKPFIKSMMNCATGASYPAVTDKIVKAYMVPLLEMEEQIKYVEFMRRVNKMKDQFNDYANASVLLHNSLQHQSFAVN